MNNRSKSEKERPDRAPVAIVGGGPGGYVAAIRLKKMGIDCVVFEKERLGGVCLNWGCIPTKTLVASSTVAHQAHNAAAFGVHVPDGISVDFPAVMNRKNQVVEQLVSGVEHLFKKLKIPVLGETVGTIRKDGDDFVLVTGEGEVRAGYVILATGSKPVELPFIPFDGERVLNSKDVLSLTELPGRMGIIGGGVIGCEFASIFSRLGVEIEIIEALPRIVNTEDVEISRRLTAALKKQGVKVHVKSKVTGFEPQENGLSLALENGKRIEVDQVLVSVGRKPVTTVGVEGATLEMNHHFWKVNASLETSMPGIFAIGDCTGPLLLAHAASAQGLCVAQTIAHRMGKAEHPAESLVYENIPRCTFTEPEIGSVGLATEEAKERFDDVTEGKFPFAANGKALGLGETFGFVKTLATGPEKTLRGMHIIGPHATELIGSGAVLIQQGASAEDAAQMIWAHPTLSEALGESIEDLLGMATHKV